MKGMMMLIKTRGEVSIREYDGPFIGCRLYDDDDEAERQRRK